jgi:hypothetical protein
MKAAIDNIETDKNVCVMIKLYLFKNKPNKNKKLVEGHGHGLLTPVLS